MEPGLKTASLQLSVSELKSEQSLISIICVAKALSKSLVVV